MICKKTVLICAIILMLPQFVLATGSSKNEKNCKNVGAVVVKCYNCGGSKCYLGEVAVLSGYEEDQGKKFCVVASQAKDACSRAFGVPGYSIGFYSKFKMGMNTVEESYNTSCVDSIGK